MKKFFITKRKVENDKRLIRVYKTRNGEPILIGYKEFRIDMHCEIGQAFLLLIDKKEIPEKYRFKSYYEVCDKYKIYELPY